MHQYLLNVSSLCYRNEVRILNITIVNQLLSMLHDYFR